MVQDQVPSAERGDQRERHLELFDGAGSGSVCREGGSEGEASRAVRWMVQDQVPSAERGDQRERHLEMFDGAGSGRLQRGGIRGRGISRCSTEVCMGKHMDTYR